MTSSDTPMTDQESYSNYHEFGSAKHAVLTLLLGLKMSAATFQPLGDLSGGNVFSVATGVSADGTVVLNVFGVSP